MLALLRWSSSGRSTIGFGSSVSAPSSACASTGSFPSNAPPAAVKLIGLAERCSRNVLAYQNNCVVLNLRFAVRFDPDHEQYGVQNPADDPSAGSNSQLRSVPMPLLGGT